MYYAERKWSIGIAVIAGLAVLCALHMSAAGRDDRPALKVDPPDLNDMLANLQSNDDLIRARTFRTLMGEHQYLREKLIEIVDREDPPYGSGHPRHLAVQLLEEFRACEAIPVFIKHIEYRQAMIADNPSFINGHPCARALVNIGRSATPHVFEYLRNSEPDPIEHRGRQDVGRPPVEVSDKAMELLGWVFLYTYGLENDGPVEATAIIRHARDRAHRKENLTRLLHMVETLADSKKRSEFIREHYVRPRKEAQNAVE